MPEFGGMDRRGASGNESGRYGRDPRGQGRRNGGTLHSVAIERTTVAFLDAYLKNDALAREWLTRDCERWLGVLGRLESR